MIIVNLPQTWPEVAAGRSTPAEVTLGQWAQTTEDDLATFGDVVVGVHKHQVVSAFDIEGWTRDPETNRVTFTGAASAKWFHLIGGPNPGPRWTQGQARPVKYIDTNDAIERAS